MKLIVVSLPLIDILFNYRSIHVFASVLREKEAKLPCRAFPPVYMNHGPISNILSKTTEQIHVI